MRLGKALWAGRSFAYHAAYNQLTRRAPAVSAALQRLTGDTGRGDDRNGEAGADYFEAVAGDYQAMAEHVGVVRPGEDLFRGRRVLELGPGDTRSVALLARLRGAAACEGYDPYDIQSRKDRYLEAIYGPLLRRAGEDASYGRAQELLDGCSVHTSAAALRAGGKRFDRVISRAVLEHVGDLDTLFADLGEVATDDAVLIHKVDLRCHGNRFDHELDFLLFPERVYRAMSSHIDLPNRVRLPEYLELGRRQGLALVYASSTHVVEQGEVLAVRDRLAHPFRLMPPAALRVLGVWLVQVGPAHPMASAAARLRPEDVGRAPLHLLSRY